MRLTRLAIPMLLLAGALLVREQATLLRPVYLGLLLWVPWLTLGSAMVLGMFLNRSRIVTAALALAVVYLVIRESLQATLADPQVLLPYALLCMSVPVVTLYLLCMPERGVFNRFGALVVAVVPAFFLAGYLGTHVPALQSALAGFVSLRMPARQVPGLVMPLYAVMTCIVVLAAGVYRLRKRATEDNVALLSAMVFGSITLALFDRALISAVVLGAAGLSLGLSLLRIQHEMAFQDELTGLPGRRALNDRLKGLGGDYVIAMMDVDHFKKFNDTWGHDVGDDVLKMVARHIGAVGGGGSAYRYGGEEFCVVFPGKDMEECEPHLDKIRRDVEAYRLVVRNFGQRPESRKTGKERRGRRTRSRDEETVSVTISIGVAERDEEFTDPQEVIKAADAALYRAKEDGRNQIAY